ncbi:39S ribosomal protein L46, mitochondrial [Thrips palmi]|uniref:Large ribosomal subunit protein mL46 n=1 Tax=Thrips palmi TaxID=161013 RepID=A0A6P8ZWB9_THRPL|nr:39S ribosomal protein L46, mitochondrial [Thrips palmi]
MFRHLSSKVLGIPGRTHSTTASSKGGKWNLVSSVCLQRKPIINKEMKDIEKQVQNLLFQVEKETSWKCDWELEIEKDLKHLQQIKESKNAKASDGTLKVGLKLRRDWEDEWKAELSNFSLQPRVTEADKKNNVKSWHRLLDSTLIFVVQSEDSGNRWVLPYGSRLEGETMRQAAERVLRESCGANLKAQFYGNAPCGYYKFKYPKAIREKMGVEGDKVFFYKAYLTGGDVKSSTALKDFKWVPRNQLSSTLSADYGQSVEMFLFDEN